MADSKMVQAICRAASNFHNGMFCPAVLWDYVTDGLTPENTAAVLNSLPGDVQIILREAYADRPWSLRSELQDSEVRWVVEQWCKGISA